MLSKIISPGDRIELTKPVKASATEKMAEKKDILEHEKRIYISQVYDILEDEQLKIAMPIVEGRVVPLPLHARYNACFYSSGGLYQAKLVITGRYKEDGLYILEAELTSELKKFQRRQYFRLEHTMDLEYKVVSDEEIMDMLEQPDKMEEITSYGMSEGIILDISGGGIRFTTKEELEKKSEVLVNINIGIATEDICRLPATIISSTKADNREKLYVNRAEFHNMKDATREKIIKYIFDLERRMRKRDN